MNRTHTSLLTALCCIALTGAKVHADPTVVTSTTTGGIPVISGWDLVAEVRSGSNGNDNLPDLDFDLIDSEWNGDGGYITWDSNDDDKFTTGAALAVWTVDLSAGTASFEVTDADGGTHTAYYTGISGTIKNVTIRSAAETPGTSAWNAPTVSFYKNGNCLESYTGNGTVPEVDTRTTASAEASSQITVTPSASDDTKIVVFSQFQLSTINSDPGANGVFGQIFLTTN